MQDLLFSANAVFPIIILIVVGWGLKKAGLFSDEFLRVGNKLTFRVLLPVLLFYNVYNIQSFSQINWVFVLYAVLAVLCVFVLGMVGSLLFTKNNAQRGVLAQAVFRSNYAIIGIPLATFIFGEAAAASASVLSAFTVPLFNILAVIALSVFNGEKPSFKSVILGIATNPLIWGVVAGLAMLGVRSLFVATNVSFRLADVGFLFTAIKFVANCTTPFALLVLGGQFKFSAVKSLWKPVVFGTVMRTVVVPSLALTVAYFLLPQLGGEHFASYIAAFGTPVAVSSAIMAKEMGADEELAGQLVVWTTVVSAMTIFAQVAIFRAIGVF